MKLIIEAIGGSIVVSVRTPGPPQIPIPKRKAGILGSLLTRALNSGEYRAEVDVDERGNVTVHEDLKKVIV